MIKAVQLGWSQLKRIKGEPGLLEVSSSAEGGPPSGDLIPGSADVVQKQGTGRIDQTHTIFGVITGAIYAVKKKAKDNDEGPDEDAGHHVVGTSALGYIEPRLRNHSH